MMNTNSTIRWFRGWLILALISMSLVSAQAVAQVMGRVQLLLGQAQVERAGQPLALVQGQDILVGDLVMTSANSTLHIKAIDQAFVVLRANSRLQIECYEPSCMKLNLLQGEMRQVTGEMGQANKAAYRLNTPVAAIGVRGTDFITKTTADQAWVRVLEGAIVAAPFDQQCMMTGIGACDTPLSRLLTAEDSHILHLRPQLAPEVQKGNGDLVAQASTSALPVSSAKLAGQAAGVSAESALLVLRDHPEVMAMYAQRLAQLPVLPPVSGGVSQPLQYATWDNRADGMAQPYQAVVAGKQMTVGDNRFVLLRDETYPYQAGQGVMRYDLTQSQASVTNLQAGVREVAVKDGALQMDFDAKRFSTQLTLDVGKAQALQLDVSGRLSRADGLFSVVTAAGTQLAGALSHDQQQVGYMLNHQLGQQDLKVLTLWQAK